MNSVMWLWSGVREFSDIVSAVFLDLESYSARSLPQQWRICKIHLKIPLIGCEEAERGIHFVVVPQVRFKSSLGSDLEVVEELPQTSLQEISQKNIAISHVKLSGRTSKTQLEKRVNGWNRQDGLCRLWSMHLGNYLRISQRFNSSFLVCFIPKNPKIFFFLMMPSKWCVAGREWLNKGVTTLIS